VPGEITPDPGLLYHYTLKKGKKMNIYVGNLASDATSEEITAAFEAFGAVASVNLIKDKYTGASRGFAFVEMESKAEAQAAMDGLNGKDFKGQPLTVNEARPRPERGNRGGRGGGRFR
jgi:RNA recognition motif-containing protein